MYVLSTNTNCWDESSGPLLVYYKKKSFWKCVLLHEAKVLNSEIQSWTVRFFRLSTLALSVAIWRTIPLFLIKAFWTRFTIPFKSIIVVVPSVEQIDDSALVLGRKVSVKYYRQYRLSLPIIVFNTILLCHHRSIRDGVLFGRHRHHFLHLGLMLLSRPHPFHSHWLRGGFGHFRCCFLQRDWKLSRQDVFMSTRLR